MTKKFGLGLSEWWRQKQEAWLRECIETMRRDPHVSLSEFVEFEKMIEDHLKKMKGPDHEIPH